jgi:hypothetical protein
MSAPWEDFQSEDGPWADFSSGGSSEDNSSILDKAKGVGEAALSLATNIPASVYGQAVGFANAARSPYKFGTPEFANYEGDITQQSTEANTYQPRTKEGQEYLNNASNFINDWLLPAGMVHGTMAPVAMPGVDAVRARLGKEAPAPRTEFEAGLEKSAEKSSGPWDDFNNPQSPNFYQARAEDQMRNAQTADRLEAVLNRTPDQTPDIINVDSQGNQVPTDQVDAARQASVQNQAQAAIEARQQALEQEVARQTSLDQNAAQRQRFENAEPAGLADARAREQFAIEQQQLAELQDSIRRTQELNQRGQQMGIVEDYGNNDPMSRMPNMREDIVRQLQPDGTYAETRMPIRADLSMELQNLENPLQRNLWGDELGPALDQQRSMTEAMDQMPPWDQPSNHVGRELNASPELNQAVSEANGYSFGGRGPSPLAKMGRGKQGGWVNPKGFEEGFQRIRDLANGLRLVFKGTENGPVIQALRKGGVVGELRAGSTNWFDPEKGNLEANFVKSSEPGVAKELYKFARDMGNDVVPSKTQTAAGKAMWDRFEKNGLSQNGKIEGVRGGNYNKQGGSSQLLTDLAYGAVKSFKAAADVAKSAVNAIADFASGLTKKIDDVYDLPKTPREVIDGIHSSIKQGLQDVIPKPEVFENLKQRILGEKDGPNLIKGIQSGALNTAQKIRSSLIEGIYHWNNYAMKRSEYAIRNLVVPTEKMFKRLSMQELSHVATVLKREMFDGKTHTVEQLRENGMTDRAIQAHQALRKNFDAALQKLNEGRAAFGKKPIEARDAYLASRWAGDWHVPIYDKEGRIQWYIREQSRKSANKALEYLKSQDFAKDLDLSKAEVTYRKSAFDPNSARDVMSAYKEFVDLLPDGPKKEAIQSAMEEHMKNEAYDFMNTKKHFLNKSNVKGFIGDQPWKNEKQQATELVKQQFAYLKDAHRWSETQQAMGEIKKFLADPDVQKAQPNNVAYAHQYLQNALGMGTNRAIAALESNVAEMLGTSRSTFYRATNNLKSMFYLQTLGGSLGYMIAAPIQAAFGIAYHRLLSTEGISHNMAKTTALSLGDTFSGLIKHGYGELAGKDANMPMTSIGKEALKYAEDNGIISHDVFDENQAIGTGKAMSAVRHTLGVTLSVPEKIGRLSAFMSFVHHLDQSGKYASKAELFQKAEDLTNIVMNDFRRSERPMMFNKLGALGEQTIPLKSFLFSYFNQLSGMSRLAAKGTVTPLLAFLGVQFMIGGLNNMPGVNEADGLFQQGKNLLAGSRNTIAAYDKVSQMRGLKEAIAANMPNWVAYGPMSALSGVNMSTRFSTSIVNTGHPLADIFPMTLDAKEAMSQAKFVLHPTEQNIAQALWVSGTPWMKGFMETHWDVFKTKNLETGQPMKDAEGRQLYQRASDLSSYQGQVARTPDQEFKRSLGLRDLGEARTNDIMYRMNENTRMQKTAQESAMDRYFDALVHGDKASMDKFAQMYAVDFGGADTFSRDLERKLKDYATTSEQREFLRRASMLNVQQMSKFKQELQGSK